MQELLKGEEEAGGRLRGVGCGGGMFDLEGH